MKYLIWLVIALAVVVWLQRVKKSITGAPGAPARPRGVRGPSRRQGQPEAMVQCAHCGIHFPVSEAVNNTAGAVFCSAEHLRLSSR